MKKEINRILGNSLRCILPSFWWKRLLGKMVDKIESAESSASSAMKMATLAGTEASNKQDRLVSGSNIKTINGESVLGRGDLRVGVSSVESVEALESLEAKAGEIATIARKIGPQAVKVVDCYLTNNTDNYASEWDKFTVIKKIEETDVNPDSSNVLYICALNESFTKDAISVGYDNGVRVYIRIVDGVESSVSLDIVNDFLATGNYRLVIWAIAGRFDSYFTFYTEVAKDVSDAYIKGDSWERLAKESDLEGIEGGSGSAEIKEEMDALKAEVDTLNEKSKVVRVYATIGKEGSLDNVLLTEEYKERNKEIYERVENGEVLFADIYGGYDYAEGQYYTGTRYFNALKGTLVGNRVVFRIENNDRYESSVTQIEIGAGGDAWIYHSFMTDKAYVDEKVANVGGTAIRELYIGDFLTEEQKAWNLETLELAKQGKAIVRTTLHGNTFILELFNEDNDYQFGYTQFSPSGGVAISVGVTEDGLSGIKIEESHFDSELSTTSINAVQNKVITAALGNKVDKVNGKQLSTEDFTSALKTKLESLRNYDDTSIQNAVNSLTTQINTLVSSDASVAIENFNEIISFLNGIEDSESLDSIIASIEQQIANKQNIITDLTDIRNGAALGKTALQSIPTEYVTDSELIAKGYATTSQLVKKQDVISDLESIRSGAVLGTTSLQEHQDIRHLATKEAVTNLTNNVLDNEEIYAAAVNDLNIRVVNTDSTLSTEISNRESLQTEFQTFKTQVTENEEIWAIALTDINDRIGTNYQHGEDTYATKESLNTKIQTINTTILDNEEVIAATLTDLNNQIASLNALITDLTNRIETLENA